ncbi:XdhC family protein [Cecembia calidifontis]|jgi:xanthine/CO dehydrogenase XdhC/CoxF family maturation factor|uniref:Xanthine/CO dehydrogenase XdhC/CoxF family maturation factor n=1 Tax=Cecembia calidifontis TaxID=1187080 RepID=A0A4Q7PC42_9BACT|nr:XdhC/CoxI family protein [Cecembia calidifontis]RZS97587.1 xanthine/CO dehydrogenase XdhC/CoxF family maturation factor [Cecembia calidifontis]
MKELHQIIQAYNTSVSSNKKTALATVVKVDGSAYRRPGARMLVTEDGELTGAISGGCLEGDALRKAQSVIFQQKSMLVTYDTTDEDDQKFGVGLGCNGIIQVLIEPILPEDPENPIELLKKALSDRSTSLLVTVFSLLKSREEQVGTKLLFKNNLKSGDETKIPKELIEAIHQESKDLIIEGNNLIKSYPKAEGLFVFYEVIKAPLRLLLFGAGNDTIPLAKMAHLMGWELWLVDGRKNHATIGRFPTANKIIVGPADEVIQNLEWDEHTVALLMTHNFEYEVVVLSRLIQYPLPYIGILGPKKKTIKLLERLENLGIQVNTSNIYGPMGLDLGAEGSEEIALSALAEIKTVLSKKTIMHLRDKPGPIHDELR